MPPPLHIVFGGDVMLGRLVASEMRARGPRYPLAPIAARMRAADLTIVNLECALTNARAFWSGESKAFYFGAPPEAVHALLHAGVDLVTLANNHTLDFDIAGLLDTMATLRAHGIAFTGAGENLSAARTPAVLERQGLRVGVVAYCDHQADFAATAHRPGIAYLDLDDEDAAIAVFRDDLVRLHALGVQWPILSLHWGPNMVNRPSSRFRRIADAVMRAGYKTLFGHSAHVFHGVGLYRGLPILYAAGDLVDDYYVDPEFHNDQQLLFTLDLIGGKSSRLTLHPVFIEDCQTRPADADQSVLIAGRMSHLCAELGTPVQQCDGELWIDCGAPVEVPSR